MPWTCQNCNRTFKNNNQSHSCNITNINSHFLNKPNELINAYKKLHNFVSLLPNVRISSVKNAILYSSESTFLAIKVKKKYLEIEFFLTVENDVFPVCKTVKISKNKIVHFIKIQNQDEIDNQILDFIRNSHSLVNKD